MSEVTKCTSRLGHKFEGRYSVSAPKGRVEEITSHAFWGGDVSQLRTKTYVHDICVRCGTIVKPSKP